MEGPKYVQGPLGLLGAITDRIVGDIRTVHGLKPGAYITACDACILHILGHMSNAMQRQH